MSAPPDVAGLVPHRGAMCLLERIVRHDPHGMALATGTHAWPHNPLRRNGRLRAIHLCEYGAQAIAAHGGFMARESGAARPPGMLVSLRDVLLHVDCVESLAGELLVEVERLAGGAVGLQYAFCISHQGRELARGRAAVIEGLPPR